MEIEKKKPLWEVPPFEDVPADVVLTAASEKKRMAGGMTPRQVVKAGSMDVVLSESEYKELEEAGEIDPELTYNIYEDEQ